ncbi:hypothetical protein NDU88_003081 [Pleurodeles waltl]|uniref:Uncharacterized protein n=1 Tax=Pleurodeles waltl TaxID=8319 RepID=A0AAV7LEA7_PLEWA|nr:hypothetical protein NDU88_003081 [Pleurodeles waltl]
MEAPGFLRACPSTPSIKVAGSVRALGCVSSAIFMAQILVRLLGSLVPYATPGPTDTSHSYRPSRLECSLSHCARWSLASARFREAAQIQSCWMPGAPLYWVGKSQSTLDTSQVRSVSQLSPVAALSRLCPPRRASPHGTEFTLWGSCVPPRELHRFPSRLTPVPDGPRCSRGAPSQNAADSRSPEAAAILDVL